MVPSPPSATGHRSGGAQPRGLQAAADGGRHLGGPEGPLERVGRDEHRAVGHAFVSHGCREGVHDDRGQWPGAARLEPRQGLLPRAADSPKLDLVHYYLETAEATVRGLYDRPTVLKRWRDGITGEVFFQKRVPEKRPEWLQTATVHFPSGRSATELVPNDAAHLIWGVNLSNIDWNPWPVRRSDLDHPDELRIDLDPQPGVEWSEVREVALCAGDVLREHGMLGFPKTSGSRGIHVNVRIEPRWSFTEVRRAALALAREVERRMPGRATTAWWKEERIGVFLDYNQNARDRTVASQYSVRAVPDAKVSCPLRWDEVADVEPEDLRLDTVPARLREVGDVSATIDDVHHSLDALLDLARRDEEEGLGDAPWPPHFAKQAGEPQTGAAEPGAHHRGEGVSGGRGAGDFPGARAGWGHNRASFATRHGRPQGCAL